MKLEDLKDGDTISIEQWNELVPQIKETHEITWESQKAGIQPFAIKRKYESPEAERLSTTPHPLITFKVDHRPAE